MKKERHKVHNSIDAQNKFSITSIAELIGKDKPVVNPEIKRNKGNQGTMLNRHRCMLNNDSSEEATLEIHKGDGDRYQG